MDKYHCKFKIVKTVTLEKFGWYLEDHTGNLVAFGTGYKNWHNAKRALDRHIKVIQSANFTLPEKPARKPYTFKHHAL